MKLALIFKVSKGSSRDSEVNRVSKRLRLRDNVGVLKGDKP